MAKCDHAPGAGMCSECAPWMFPSEEQQAATEQWFKDYRAYHVKRTTPRIRGHVLRKPGRPRTTEPCRYEGCKRVYYARGLCQMHYLRERYHALRSGGTMDTHINIEAPGRSANYPGPGTSEVTARAS